MSRTPLNSALPDLTYVADGGVLVAEVEAYLRSLPTPPPRPQTARICAFGQVFTAWDAEMPQPHRSVGDRLRGRAPGPVPLETSAFLRLVSRYLVASGWCQRLMYDADGRRCLLGAMVAVLAAGYGTEATARRARTALIEQIITDHPGLTSIDVWNDMPGRTAAQVHRQLDIAAARTRGRG